MFFKKKDDNEKDLIIKELQEINLDSHERINELQEINLDSHERINDLRNKNSNLYQEINSLTMKINELSSYKSTYDAILKAVDECKEKGLVYLKVEKPEYSGPFKVELSISQEEKKKNGNE